MLKQITRLYERIAIEIGSAYGDLLIELAKSNPHTMYIGIEIDRERHEIAIEKLEKNCVHNAVFFNAEGDAFLENHISSEMVDEVHIYFPSPYPKYLNKNPNIVKKVSGWLVNEEFISDIYRILAAGGNLRIVTDHKDYFEETTRIISKNEFYPTVWTHPARQNIFESTIGTFWEKKQMRNGKKIYCVQCVK